jgi:ribosomal protein S21
MGVSLVRVKVRDGNITQALKVFKKKVTKSNHLEELKKRQEYLKPSVVKHKLDQDIRFKRRRENGK